MGASFSVLAERILHVRIPGFYRLSPYMIPKIIESYLLEIILLGGFFLAGPLARIIADAGIEDTAEKRGESFIFIRSIFRRLFAGLIALWLLLFKAFLPLL